VQNVKHLSSMTFDIAFEHHHQRLEKRLQWILQRNDEQEADDRCFNGVHHLEETPCLSEFQCAQVSAETGSCFIPSESLPSLSFPIFSDPHPPYALLTSSSHTEEHQSDPINNTLSPTQQVDTQSPQPFLNSLQDADNISILVTDLTKTLCDNEKQLLAKGPKFAVGEGLNDQARTNIKVNFCRLANELRWKEHWNRNPDLCRSSANAFPRYPYRDEISQAPRYPDFERKLARINESISRCIDATNIRKASNISKSERNALASLKKKDIVCLPSDKGGEFCVLDRSQYIELGLQHLKDNRTYVTVSRISAKTIETKINKVWKEVCEVHQFDTAVTKSYIASNTNLATFYFLVKTHKSSVTPKIRPIVSNVDSPTTKLSWLLGMVLKPLLSTVEAHLENTSDLCKRLSSLTSSSKVEYNYPFSLDVVSLYTSIPPKEAIEVARRCMQNRSYLCYGMDHDDVCKLLDAVLANNYFIFDDITYRQVHGLAMGNSVSAVLAILYMDYVEKKALSMLGDRVGLYCRYVDDAFLLARNRSDAEHVKEIFDNVDPNIKFDIEHPDDSNTLNLLDIKININSRGEQRTQFYKKSARKPIFVNFKSALPANCKLNYIRNERERIRERCSDNKDSIRYLSEFNSVLKLNGYPNSFIRKGSKPAKFRPQKRRAKELNVGTFSYFSIPFYNETINNKIRKAFHREGLKVRLSHKSFSLRSALRHKRNNNRICTKKNCTLSQDLCFRKNVVYKITCNKCLKTYIGSTIRELHQRVYEHFKNKDSSVHKHMIACNTSPEDMDVRIIDCERRKGNLRIREALQIQRHQPKINTKEESTIDLVLF